MAESWRTHSVRSTSSVDTIADGIAVRVPVPEALGDLARVVDDIVLVSDDAIKRAMQLIDQHLDLIAEPAAATGVAALLSHSALVQELVCTPITGGNATLEQLRAWTTQIQ
jgi:threonine dehydratase